MKAHKDKLDIERKYFPRSWVAGDGTTYPKLALERLSIAEQEALGWYEIVDNPPAYDSSSEKIISGSLTFSGSEIVKIYTVVMLPMLSDEQVAIQFKVKIEEFIYSKYPFTQQAQDQVWMSSYLTQIKASGFDNPELFVVVAIQSILGGSTLDSELSAVTDELQVKALNKLVKIGLRITWVEQVIDALKAGVEPPEWVVY